MLPMADTPNPTAVYKMIDARRGQWLKKITKETTAAIKADYLEAAARIRETTGTRATTAAAVFAAIISGQRDWRSFYLKTYLNIGVDFATETDQGLNAAFGKAGPGADQAKADENLTAIWTAEIGNYIEEEGGQKIQTISGTTQRRIADTLEDGWAAGEGADVLADRVVAASKYTDARGLTIARTEVIGASNMGSHTAAGTFQLPLDKVWRTTIDGRERSNHNTVNNQKRDLDKPFLIFGNLLMFPGDTSLNPDPGQTINCRCVNLYHPKKI